MKNIAQTEIFDAEPVQVYGVFMNAQSHAAFTNAAARIDDKVGGEFEVWDGYATGKNLELIPNKKIVQSWRASDWPEGIESTITIELSVDNGKTKMEFTQTGIPDEFAADFEQGWTDYYWQPMKEYLEK
ncbi:MAG: SRPBCC family protein [Candidatus Berkelbacteria bacterium]